MDELQLYRVLTSEVQHDPVDDRDGRKEVLHRASIRMNRADALAFFNDQHVLDRRDGLRTKVVES